MPLVPLQAAQVRTLQRWLDRGIQAALAIFVSSTVVSISLMQISSGLALLAWLARLALGGGVKSCRRRPPLVLPFVSFLLAACLSAALAVEPARGFWELRDSFTIGMVFLVAVEVTRQRATQLLHLLMAAGAVMALYGLSQSMRYGADFRIHGTMSIYMTFAGVLMLVTTMVLAQGLFSPRRRSVLWSLATLPVFLAALLMTQTRNAWLGLTVGLAIGLGLRQKRLLVLLPCVILGAFLLAPTVVQERLRSVFESRTLNAQQRYYIWERGVQIIQHSPWIGVGPGGVPRVYAQYRLPEDPRDTGKRRHLHNNVLHVTAETGVLGLACWLTIWVAFYRHGIGVYRRLAPERQDARALVVGSLACVTSLHIAGLFEYNFGDVEVISLLYFIMAFPAVVAREHSRQADAHQGGEES